MAWKEYECHSSEEHNESNDQRPVRMHGIRSRSCRVEMSAAQSHKWNVGERNDCNSAEREQRKQTAELSACGWGRRFAKALRLREDSFSSTRKLAAVLGMFFC